MTKNQISNKIIFNHLFAAFFSLILAASVCAETNQTLDPMETIEDRFNGWIKVCNSQTNNCVGVQFAENVSGTKIARFVFDRIKPKKNGAIATATLLIPFKTSIVHLPSGIIIQIDKNQPIKEQYYYCDLDGCNVKFLLTQRGIDLIKLGSNMTIRYKDIRNTKKINIMDISLIGFSDFYSSLED